MSTDFENDLFNHNDLLNLIKDETFAKNLYASLCNVSWRNEEKIFSCSWRYAGDIVSRLRNVSGNLNETYLDFYCSGCEGHIFPDVLEVLLLLGWKPEEKNNP